MDHHLFVRKFAVVLRQSSIGSFFCGSFVRILNGSHSLGHSLVHVGPRSCGIYSLGVIFDGVARCFALRWLYVGVSFALFVSCVFGFDVGTLLGFTG